MESAPALRELIKKDDFMRKIGLKDTYVPGWYLYSSKNEERDKFYFTVGTRLAYFFPQFYFGSTTNK